MIEPPKPQILEAVALIGLVALLILIVIGALSVGHTP